MGGIKLLSNLVDSLEVMILGDTCDCPAGAAERLYRLQATGHVVAFLSFGWLVQYLTMTFLDWIDQFSRFSTKTGFFEIIGLLVLGIIIGAVVLLGYLMAFHSLKEEKQKPLSRHRELRKAILRKDLSRSMAKRPELSEDTWDDVMRRMYSEDHHEPITDTDLLNDYREVLEDIQKKHEYDLHQKQEYDLHHRQN